MTDDIWESIGKAAVVAVFGAVGVVSLLLLWATLGSLMGFVAGWILSKTFLGDAIIGGMFALLGKQIDAGALPHIGAFLGFISGFFKHAVRIKTDKR